MQLNSSFYSWTFTHSVATAMACSIQNLLYNWSLIFVVHYFAAVADPYTFVRSDAKEAQCFVLLNGCPCLPNSGEESAMYVLFAVYAVHVCSLAQTCTAQNGP